MAWFTHLLDSVVDRIAVKVTQKVELQLTAAVDAALDQVEDRIDVILKKMGRCVAPPPQRPSIQVEPPSVSPGGSELDELRAQLRSRIGRYMPEIPDR